MEQGLIIGFIMVIIFFIVSMTRKGTSALKEKPKKIMSFNTELFPDKIFEISIDYAKRNKYKIDDIDKNIGRIILSDSISLSGFGFFYPIYTSKQNDGKILVEIGIKSRAFQGGPLVTKKHKKFFDGIKSEIMTNIQNINIRTESMFCKKCGKPIDFDNSFCSYCGGEI